MCVCMWGEGGESEYVCGGKGKVKWKVFRISCLALTG